MEIMFFVVTVVVMEGWYFHGYPFSRFFVVLITAVTDRIYSFFILLTFP
jgi:hypothetical protein